MIGALTNHLWQSTLFAVAAGLLIFAFRKNRAQVRHWLWLSASLKFLLPFSLLIGLGSHLGWAPAASRTAAHAVSLTIVQVAQPFPASLSFAPSTPRTTDWGFLAILAVWGCGCGLIAFTRLRLWLRIRSAVRSSTLLQIPAAVEVRSSAGLLEPGVAGLLKPVLLLPEGITERLTPPQLQAVLAHELCHVRRRDNLAAAIHMIVEALFWFHPVVWCIGARLVKERERACDEEVLRLGNDPRVYAEGILSVCRFYVELPLTCVAGVTGANLRRRVELIMRSHVGTPLNLWRKLLLTTAGVVALAVPIGLGLEHATPILAEAHPQEAGANVPLYDVVLIKPDKSSGKNQYEKGGFYFITATGVTVHDLVRQAYGVEDSQIEGGPNWLNSDRYNIDAKATRPDGSIVDELSRLGGDVLRQRVGQANQFNLQAILADRFQLTFHRETKKVPVYELVIANSGVKLRESTLNDSHQGVRVIQVRRGQITGREVPLATLVKLLSEELDRPIVDKTGLTDYYNINLRWAATVRGQPGILNTLTPGSSDPSIFTAVQSQLGLKLEAQEVPKTFFVIDHVEHPSEN